ncbi:unnamed protein product [Prunus armeniaca]
MAILGVRYILQCPKCQSSKSPFSIKMVIPSKSINFAIKFRGWWGFGKERERGGHTALWEGGGGVKPEEAGKKVRTFGVGRTCRRQRGRSSRQASDIGVVPAEGSSMLKSAICGNFGRVTGSENESFAQSFDVGLCASFGGDTCP